MQTSIHANNSITTIEQIIDIELSNIGQHSYNINQTLHSGNKLHLSITENPSTGYKWILQSNEQNANLLQLDSDSFVLTTDKNTNTNNNNHIVGTSGYRILHFTIKNQSRDNKIESTLTYMLQPVWQQNVDNKEDTLKQFNTLIIHYVVN